MIIGIGIDTVEIQRFNRWHTYPPARLQRIFSKQEIAYCLSCPAKSAERFAVRFAAREAFYKAYCQAFPGHTVPFLRIYRFIAINHAPNGHCILHRDKALPWPAGTSCLCTCTHSRALASAWIIIQETKIV